MISYLVRLLFGIDNREITLQPIRVPVTHRERH